MNLGCVYVCKLMHFSKNICIVEQRIGCSSWERLNQDKNHFVTFFTLLYFNYRIILTAFSFFWYKQLIKIYKQPVVFLDSSQNLTPAAKLTCWNWFLISYFSGNLVQCSFTYVLINSRVLFIESIPICLRIH